MNTQFKRFGFTGIVLLFATATFAGVKTDYVKLEDVGLPGNAHEMMLEKNSDGIAAFFESWIEKNVH